MDTSSNHSWIPPDRSVLEFSNCTAAGEWAAVYWRSPDLPLLLTVDLLRKGFSTYMNNNNLTAPTDGEIMQWIMYDLRDDNWTIPDAIDQWAYTYCLGDVCPRIGWQGNSDLAGPGVSFCVSDCCLQRLIRQMLACYFLQASLATFYWIMLSLGSFTRTPRRVRNHPTFKRILTAVQQSTRVFLDGAVVFASVMLIAAAAIYIRAIANRKTPLPTSSALVTAYFSFNSMYPVAVIYFVASEKLRRTYGRRAVWTFMTIVATLVMSLWLVLMYMPGLYTSAYKFGLAKDLDDPEAQDKFDWNCVGLTYVLSFRSAVFGQLALLANLGLNAVVMAAWEPDGNRWSPQNLQRIYITKQIWRWLTSMSCITAMWYFPIAYLGYQQLLIGDLGGITNKDNDLSFGQILALSTWAPVVIDLAYIYWIGPREALSGKIMAPFHVVSSEDLGGLYLKTSEPPAPTQLSETYEQSGPAKISAASN
jgi:hypothetical protein